MTLKEKKKPGAKRKESQKPNTVKQYFQTASTTVEFSNENGRLALAGKDDFEIERLLLLIVSVPAVASFMEIEQKDKKKPDALRKGLT